MVPFLILNGSGASRTGVPLENSVISRVLLQLLRLAAEIVACGWSFHVLTTFGLALIP